MGIFDIFGPTNIWKTCQLFFWCCCQPTLATEKGIQTKTTTKRIRQMDWWKKSVCIWLDRKTLMMDLVEQTVLDRKMVKLSQNGCCWAALQSWTDDDVNNHFVPCKGLPFCRSGHQPGGTGFCQWTTLGMEPLVVGVAPRWSVSVTASWNPRIPWRTPWRDTVPPQRVLGAHRPGRGCSRHPLSRDRARW